MGNKLGNKLGNKFREPNDYQRKRDSLEEPLSREQRAALEAQIASLLNALPEHQLRKKWNPLQTLSLMLMGGVALAGLVVGIGVWRTGSQFINNLHAVFDNAQPPPQVDVRSLVVEQIRSASELTTAIFAMEAVVPASRDRTLGGYTVGTTTLLYIAYGEVRAGVDLSEIKPEDVQVVDDKVYLRLPPPRILDSKIDVNRSKVYDYDRGFLGLGPDVAPQLQELAQRTTLSKIVEAACNQGVLRDANNRAELAVRQLLNTTGYRDLAVETQPPAPDACRQPAYPPTN